MSDTLPTRHRWGLPLLAVVLLAVGLGIGLAIAAADNDASPAQTSTAVQPSNVNQACTNWMMTTPAAAQSSMTWCVDMTGWMNQQVTSGQMMGTMMWGDPDRLLTNCQAWVAANPADAVPLTWCDDMIAWMRQHMNGDWNGWMMNGSMMGR